MMILLELFDNYAGDYAVTINLNKNWKWIGVVCCVFPMGKNLIKLSL